jgi:hypothetical protein
MAENLYCMIKGCNNDDFKGLHICRKHFYKLSKDRREDLIAMHRVHLIGELSEEKLLFFVRKVCKLLEGAEVITMSRLVNSKKRKINTSRIKPNSGSLI